MSWQTTFCTPGGVTTPNGRDRLRIATACFQQRVARHGELRGASGRVTGLDLGDQRKNNKNDGAEQRGKADQSVKQKTNRQINRHPSKSKKATGPLPERKPRTVSRSRMGCTPSPLDPILSGRRMIAS